MADSYMVGRKPGKDKYMVGANVSAEAKNAYRVGNSKSGPGQSSNKALGSGDQDPVVGSKSAFSYSEMSTKDIGDKSDNMNFGGGESGGVAKNPNKAGGEIDLVYSEKGSFNDSKDAMARRKARADASRDYAKSGDGYQSPVPQVDAK